MREELDIPMAIQGSQIYPGEHYNKIQTALKQSTVREERHSKELRSSETKDRNIDQCIYPGVGWLGQIIDLAPS